jgi:hypothetical protein
MASQQCCETECSSHAMQRSLYRHALNALRYASRSSCTTEETRELAERCAEMLRALDEQMSAAAGR